jgi:hypothetical protein
MKDNRMNDHTKHLFDWLSLSVVGATLVQALPSIAAIVSIVWGLIRIYETKTVQKLLGKTPS